MILEPAKRQDAVEFFIGLRPKRKGSKRIDWGKELYQRYR